MTQGQVETSLSVFDSDNSFSTLPLLHFFLYTFLLLWFIGFYSCNYFYQCSCWIFIPSIWRKTWAMIYFWCNGWVCHEILHVMLMTRFLKMFFFHMMLMMKYAEIFYMMLMIKICNTFNYDNNYDWDSIKSYKSHQYIWQNAQKGGAFYEHPNIQQNNTFTFISLMMSHLTPLLFQLSCIQMGLIIYETLDHVCVKLELST